MDNQQSTRQYKTPSYLRKANLDYYYRCKNKPEKQEHIKERQKKNAKSYYERNKEMIKEKERIRYAKRKEEKLKKKAEQELKEEEEQIKIQDELEDLESYNASFNVETPESIKQEIAVEPNKKINTNNITSRKLIVS